MKIRTNFCTIGVALIGFFFLVSGTAVSQDDFEYKVTPIKDGITMLHGGGGNIAVLESERGLLVVDNGYEQNSKVLEAALEQFSAETQYVLNTHWHGDHTGGNAELANDATIFAHTNVRVRMATGSEAVDPMALPVVTYEDGVTLNFAEQTVKARHLPAGHTDGDTAVYFEQANVMHTGDHMFKDWFPYIDKDSGGTVDGYINNVQAIMDMIDVDTIVIPGHGPIANLEDMQRFKDMIVATRAEVAALKASGLDLAAAQAQGLDGKWESWGTFFIKEDRWIATLWDDV
ncbi:MAG: MBL fold metallo-hydrolase [Arenicella sp.]|jgi:cyclase|nr:MBL fold metallo-hydrolase [Arenicella sp.]